MDFGSAGQGCCRSVTSNVLEIRLKPFWLSGLGDNLFMDHQGLKPGTIPLQRSSRTFAHALIRHSCPARIRGTARRATTLCSCFRLRGGAMLKLDLSMLGRIGGLCPRQERLHDAIKRACLFQCEQREGHFGLYMRHLQDNSQLALHPTSPANI